MSRLRYASVLLLTPALGWAQPAPTPVIDHPWARATTDLAQMGAAYLTITSPVADAVVGAASPAARTVEVHLSREENGVMQMRPVASLPLPAGVPVRLAPGGYHVMLTGLVKPLHEGDHFPITLSFAHAAPVTTDVTVEKIGAAGPVAMMPGMPMDHAHH